MPVVLPQFTSSAECRGGHHCGWCRDLVRGRGFRTALAREFAVPADAPDFACPHGKPWGYDPPTPRPDPHAPWGNALWAEIHTMRDADQAYVDSILPRLPCGECKRDWPGVLKALPPVFGAGWFARSVEWHDAINEKKGKPRFGLPAARVLYGVE